MQLCGLQDERLFKTVGSIPTQLFPECDYLRSADRWFRYIGWYILAELCMGKHCYIRAHHYWRVCLVGIGNG